MHITPEIIEDCAARAGLSVVSCLTRQQVESSMKIAEPRLTAWQQAGYAGNMNYMTRSSSLICHPERLLPDYKTILCFFTNYRNISARLDHMIPVQGYGRISVYASVEDYHFVLKQRINLFLEYIKKHIEFREQVAARIFCDAVPTLERAFAAESGSGFIGKNSMFIKPGFGSFGFLGEVVWNIEIKGELKKGDLIGVDGCKSCSGCKKKCPTGAIVQDRIVDSRKCISYLTIEKKGYLMPDEAKSIGYWLFGCDECQMCCPYNNANCQAAELSEFKTSILDQFQSLVEILDLTEETFSEKFDGTALKRAGRESLLRNACIVAANTCFVEVLPRLLKLSLNENSEIIRQQSAAAIKILRSIK